MKPKTTHPPIDSSRRQAIKKLLLGSVGTAGMTVAGSAKAAPAVNSGWAREDPAYVGQEGKRWSMLIDLRKCIGCQACTASCKIENNVPDGQFRTTVPDVEIGQFPDVKRVFLPRLCNHCERPSCIEPCPAGATWQRRDGVVEIDYELCIGCGSCVNACPYDARFINPVTQTADKCSFCSQRIDQGLLPACVETCVGGARQFGDLNDPDSAVAKAVATEPVQVLRPETGNEPRVFYIGLTHTMQNNLSGGKPTLWSSGREYLEKESEWRIPVPFNNEEDAS